MTLRLRRLFTGLALVALVPVAARAQQPTRVTGQVTDAGTLRPLPGVQVVVKGTTVGSLTDARGRYVLNAPAGRDSLLFTYLGYRTLTRAVAPVVNVNMEVEAVALSGIVVTALGIEREKRSIPFSAQTVTGDKLAAMPGTQALTALQGQVAGIGITQASTPGGTARIVIRGASSITGNNQPLIVVDGVPMDNYAPSNGGYGSTADPTGGFDVGNAGADINPNDIASVTVLKGPNAAALYGSSAANGAIVIVTKNGTGMAADRGWGLSASIGSQIENPLRLPDYQNQYGQGSGGEFQFVDGVGGGVNDGYDESWGPKLDGRLIDQFFGAQQPWVAHPDNVRSFFETGVVSSLNLAVARSTERNNVRLSFGRNDENGMYPTNRNIKTDLGFNGGLQLSSKLSTEASVNYTVDNRRDMPGTGYEEINPMQGFVWFGRQVDMKLLKQTVVLDPSNPMYNTIATGAGFRTDAAIPYSWNYNYHPNPYWMATMKKTAFTRNRVLGHASATYKLNDWLSITGRTGRDWYTQHTRVNYPVNDISPLNTGGLLDNVQVRTLATSDVLATANRSLTKDVTMTLNAGSSIGRTDYTTNKNVVNALVVPGVYTMENSDGVPTTTIYNESKKKVSAYGSANFNYKGWFSVDVTGRNDWSSTLPKNGNSYFYPSVGGAFIFTDALGIHSRLLNSGKLRASWTRVGNDTDPYTLAAVYAAGTAWGGLPTYTVPGQLPNANLKPEETTGEEVGTDLGLFNDRLVLNATLYKKTTKNQIFPVTISPTTGFTSFVVNAGDMQNKGVELEANFTPIQLSNGFRWNVVANWSKNENKVVALFGNTTRVSLGTYWNVNVTADLGQPYGNLVGRTFLHDSATGQVIVGSNGLPRQDATQRVLGNYNPDWVGGITNTFSYKALSLSVLFDGQKGGQVYSVTKWFGQYAGVLKATLQGRENDNCDPGIVVPGLVKNSSGALVPNTKNVCAQDYWENTFYSQQAGIVDASYIKLRDARLSINLPSRLVSRAGFSQATLSIVGHNLALFTKQKTIDPETNFDAGNRQGVENGQFPTARTIGFTLSVRP